MSFDLLAYAAERRLRTRNLHDGGPVPPTRPRRTTGGPAKPAYRGRNERQDVVICRNGYVALESGRKRLSVAVLCRSRRGVRRCLPALQAAGFVAVQIGDTEAAGSAPG